jgi:hypothetical protein
VNNRTFVAGLVVCVALMFAFGGALFLLNHGHNRPEGVAEDWLTAVGDTTREGVEADATRRADKIGPLELADRRLVSDDTDGKSAFPDLEVGKAVRLDPNNPDNVKVAFQVHARRGPDESVKVVGTLTLTRVNDDWQVNAVDLVGDENTEGLPAATVLAGVPPLASEGGPPPSSAPISLWIGASIGAVLVGLLTSALVKAAEPDRTAVAA